MAKSKSPFEQMLVQNKDPRDSIFNNPLNELQAGNRSEEDILDFRNKNEKTPQVAAPQSPQPSIGSNMSSWSGAIGDTQGQGYAREDGGGGGEEGSWIVEGEIPGSESGYTGQGQGWAPEIHETTPGSGGWCQPWPQCGNQWWQQCLDNGGEPQYNPDTGNGGCTNADPFEDNSGTCYDDDYEIVTGYGTQSSCEDAGYYYGYGDLPQFDNAQTEYFYPGDCSATDSTCSECDENPSWFWDYDSMGTWGCNFTYDAGCQAVYNQDGDCVSCCPCDDYDSTDPASGCTDNIPPDDDGDGQPDDPFDPIVDEQDCASLISDDGDMAAYNECMNIVDENQSEDDEGAGGDGPTLNCYNYAGDIVGCYDCPTGSTIDECGECDGPGYYTCDDGSQVCGASNCPEPEEEPPADDDDDDDSGGTGGDYCVARCLDYCTYQIVCPPGEESGSVINVFEECCPED